MKPEEVKTVMSEFDKEGDGHIDLEELTAILNGSSSTKDLRQKCSVLECAAMITNFDVDGDGFINFQEFKKMMNRS
ncbi:hypothetical protein ACLB2K_077199 [Fragaria x ananassa]